MSSGLFYFSFLDRSISNRRSVWLVFIITMFYRKSVFYANSVDPDQMQRSAASDLDLNCLQMPLL